MLEHVINLLSGLSTGKHRYNNNRKIFILFYSIVISSMTGENHEFFFCDRAMLILSSRIVDMRRTANITIILLLLLLHEFHRFRIKLFRKFHRVPVVK